jgi:ABC-type arginine transport system permease subunit
MTREELKRLFDLASALDSKLQERFRNDGLQVSCEELYLTIIRLQELVEIAQASPTADNEELRASTTAALVYLVKTLQVTFPNVLDEIEEATR